MIHIDIYIIEYQIYANSLFYRCTYLNECVFIHRSKVSVCKIIEFTLKSLRNAQSFRPKSSSNHKTTEACKNGARLLTKIHYPPYNIEALTSSNATEAFSTKNFL